jgi:hypothetical protein
MHFKSQRVDARVDHAIMQIPIDKDKKIVIAGLKFQIGEKLVESKIQEKVKA